MLKMKEPHKYIKTLSKWNIIVGYPAKQPPALQHESKGWAWFKHALVDQAVKALYLKYDIFSHTSIIGIPLTQFLPESKD